MAHIRDDLSTGRRLYVQTSFGEPVVDRLKALGVHWDREARCWWISPQKRRAVEELLVESDQKKEEGVEPEKKPDDPDRIRLLAKVRYEGKTYFASFMGQTKRGQSAKLHTLPDDKDQFRTFWVDLDKVEVLKRYEPREVWDGRRYSGKTRLQYTTLGSLADFIRRQKNPDTRRVQCPECDSWHDAGEGCRECGGC